MRKFSRWCFSVARYTEKRASQLLMTEIFKTMYPTFLYALQYFQRDEKAVNEGEEKKFDPSGYDKDLVESLERDIVQRNPNVHWYVQCKIHCS